MVAALAGRDLRRFFRQPSRIVGSAAQPLILWAVLGAGFAGSFRPGGGAGVGYLQYFYPGVVVLTLLFTAIFSTISVIEDRHHGFLQAVLAAPVSRVGLVLGKSLGGVAIASVQAGILQLLRDLATDRRLAVLLVTHDLGVMSAIADEVAVMKDGVVVERADRETLFRDPQHEYTRALLAALPGSRIEAADADILDAVTKGESDE